MKVVDIDAHFIDGEWLPSRGRDQVDLVNPTTGRSRGRMPIGDGADVDRAVRAASTALEADAWTSYSLAQRCEAIRGMQAWIQEHAVELAEDISTGLGQPIRHARTLGNAQAMIEMYVESISRLDLQYLRRDATGTALIRRRPVGVAAGITPWNTPVRGEVKKVVPALLSGCTIVLKPAPESPIGAIAIAEAARAIDLPSGVVNVVFGDGSTGAALVAHELVSKIGFTGSTTTGTKIAELSAGGSKRVQLELGGKSPAVVLDDADIESALAQVGANVFANAGQTCTALTRVVVPRHLQSQVVESLVEQARGHQLGDPRDESTTMGPLVSRRQRDRVLDYIKIGTNDGARLATGGRVPPGLEQGWFVEPTVFADTTNEMRVAREEIFGPVVCVIAYDDIEEALWIANDSPYGLTGAVFGTDEERALSVAQRINSGTVSVNRVGRIDSGPFGGVKSSGVGREQGPEGFDSYLEYQAVAVSAAQYDRLDRAGFTHDRRH